MARKSRKQALVEEENVSPIEVTNEDTTEVLTSIEENDTADNVDIVNDADIVDNIEEDNTIVENDDIPIEEEPCVNQTAPSDEDEIIDAEVVEPQPKPINTDYLPMLIGMKLAFAPSKAVLDGINTMLPYFKNPNAEDATYEHDERVAILKMNDIVISAILNTFEYWYNSIHKLVCDEVEKVLFVPKTKYSIPINYIAGTDTHATLSQNLTSMHDNYYKPVCKCIQEFEQHIQNDDIDAMKSTYTELRRYLVGVKKMIRHMRSILEDKEDEEYVIEMGGEVDDIQTESVSEEILETADNEMSTESVDENIEAPTDELEKED